MDPYTHRGMNIPNSSTSGPQSVPTNTTNGTSRLITNVPTNQNPPNPADLYRQMNQLSQQFSSYQLENDQKIEQINIKTSFQLQLINERLGNMETKFANLHNEIFANRKDTNTGTVGNENIQKKIELIGKHMADLSSDITKLNPNDNSNNSTPNSTATPSNSLLNAADNVGNMNNSKNDNKMSPPEVLSSAFNSHGANQASNSAVQAAKNQAFLEQSVLNGSASMDMRTANPEVLDPLMSRPLPASTISDPLSNRPHNLVTDNGSGANHASAATVIPAPNPTSALNGGTGSNTAAANGMGTNFSDNHLMDINKQWSRALGIRSPGIESPFTPKQLGFDYSIPINRALSFNNNSNPTNQSNLTAANSANASAVSAIGASTPPVGNRAETPPRMGPVSTMPRPHQSLNQVVNSVGSMNSVASVASANSVNSVNSVESNVDANDMAVGVNGVDVVDSLEKKKMENNLLSTIENADTNFGLMSGDVGDEDIIDQDYKRRRKLSKSSDSSDNKSPNGISSVGSTGSSNYNSKNHKTYDAPQFKLEKGARDVSEIWKEYEYGIMGKPPLKSLENKYNTRWRNDTESRTFVRRKKIYSAIETGKARGYNEEDIIEELENLRTYYSNGTVRKKPLSWLYTNIPKKYQS